MRKAVANSARTISRSGKLSKYAVTHSRLLAASFVSVPRAPASIKAYSTASRATGSSWTSSAYHPALVFASPGWAIHSPLRAANLLREVHPELGAKTEFVQEVLLVTPVGLDFDK